MIIGIEASADVMNPSTALECSFMAPGLGPVGHPDMGPYVDERIYRGGTGQHPTGYIELGQEWHSKVHTNAHPLVMAYSLFLILHFLILNVFLLLHTFPLGIVFLLYTYLWRYYHQARYCT